MINQVFFLTSTVSKCKYYFPAIFQHTCTCKAGYSGDGQKSCKPVDICSQVSIANTAIKRRAHAQVYGNGDERNACTTVS